MAQGDRLPAEGAQHGVFQHLKRDGILHADGQFGSAAADRPGGNDVVQHIEPGGDNVGGQVVPFHHFQVQQHLDQGASATAQFGVGHTWDGEESGHQPGLGPVAQIVHRQRRNQADGEEFLRAQFLGHVGPDEGLARLGRQVAAHGSKTFRKF